MTTSQGSGAHIMRDVDGAWSRHVSGLSASTLAHAPEWFAPIRNTYGHEPLYLMAEDGAGHAGVLPAFVVRRPLFGTVIASMPFLDAGGPCASSPALAHVLVERLVAEAHQRDAKTIELRSTQRLPLAIAPMEHKVTLTLPLDADPDRLWRQLDGSVRNQVRKAERSAVTVQFGGAEGLDDFYAVFAHRMRELGSPVHSRSFFSAIIAAFGRRARVVVARKDGVPIGGLIALAFKEGLAVPWASCLREHFALCPNMLLYWQTIRHACLEGFSHFDFGRSTRGSGTHRFKCQWGAREQPLFWYAIPVHGRSTRPGPAAGSSAAFLTGSWRHLPLAVTRYLGPRIRRYLTQ